MWYTLWFKLYTYIFSPTWHGHALTLTHTHTHKVSSQYAALCGCSGVALSCPESRPCRTEEPIPNTAAPQPVPQQRCACADMSTHTLVITGVLEFPFTPLHTFTSSLRSVFVWTSFGEMFRRVSASFFQASGSEIYLPRVDFHWRCPIHVVSFY